MAGLRRIARSYGGLKARDAKGNEVTYAWDYAAEEPVRAEDMPEGSERWQASERARYAKVLQDNSGDEGDKPAEPAF